jgi:uncharacterized damage-inducible protein DinB
MPTSLADRFRRWFDYEKDAHAKVVRSLESVPEPGREGPEYRKAVDRLAHILAARRVWLWRLGVVAEAPKDLFPESVTLAEVAGSMPAVHALWDDYLAGLTDEDLERTVEYTSLDGGRFRNRVEEILTQLFGHSWYHRGQIATLVRAAGGEPALTDWIFWCRERVAS